MTGMISSHEKLKHNCLVYQGNGRTMQWTELQNTWQQIIHSDFPVPIDFMRPNYNFEDSDRFSGKWESRETKPVISA
jgi:hypothetical protein